MEERCTICISALRDERCVTQVHLPMAGVPEAEISTTLTMSSNQLPATGVLYLALYWGPQLQDAAPLLVLPDNICQELHGLFMTMCTAQNQQQQQQLQVWQQMVQQNIQGGRQLPTGLSIPVMETLELEKHVWQHHFRSLTADLAFILRSYPLPPPAAAASSSSNSSSSQARPNLQHLLSGGSVATSAANSGSSSPRSTSSSSSDRPDPAVDLLQRIMLSVITSTAAAVTHIPWTSLIDPDPDVTAQVAGRLAWFIGRQGQPCKETLDFIAHLVIAAATAGWQQQRDREQIRQWQQWWLDMILTAPEPSEAEMLAVQATEDITAAVLEAAAAGDSADVGSDSTVIAAPQLAAALGTAAGSSSGVAGGADGGASLAVALHHQPQQQMVLNRYRSAMPTLPTISSGGSSSASSNLTTAAAGNLSSLVPQQQQRQQQSDHPSPGVGNLEGSPLALLDILLTPPQQQQQQQQQQQHNSGPAAPAAAAGAVDQLGDPSTQHSPPVWSPTAAVAAGNETAAGGRSIPRCSTSGVTGPGGSYPSSSAAAAGGCGWSSSSDDDEDEGIARTPTTAARANAAAADDVTPPRGMQRQRSPGSTTPLPLPGYLRQHQQQQQQQQATTGGLRRRAAALAGSSAVYQTPPPTTSITAATAAAAAAPPAASFQGPNRPLLSAVMLAALTAAVIAYCYIVIWQQPETHNSAAASSSSCSSGMSLVAQIGDLLLQLPIPVLLLIVLPPLLLLAAWMTTPH